MSSKKMERQSFVLVRGDETLVLPANTTRKASKISDIRIAHFGKESKRPVTLWAHNFIAPGGPGIA